MNRWQGLYVLRDVAFVGLAPCGSLAGILMVVEPCFTTTRRSLSKFASGMIAPVFFAFLLLLFVSRSSESHRMAFSQARHCSLVRVLTPPLSQNRLAAPATKPAPSRAAVRVSALSLVARSWRYCCHRTTFFSVATPLTPPIRRVPRISFFSGSHQRFHQQRLFSAGTLLLTQKRTFPVDRVCKFRCEAF